MFTCANVPGVPDSHSARMARTPEQVSCRERADRGSGRRDLVTVTREVRCVVEEVRDAAGRVVRRRLRALLPEEVAYAGRTGREVVTVAAHERVPQRRNVATVDLEALRDRFGRR